MRADLPVTIIHTKNRWSRARFIKGGVEIRLAYQLSPLVQKHHIEHLLGRLHSLRKRLIAKQIIDPFQQILLGANEQKVSFWDGRTVCISVQQGSRFAAKNLGNVWVVTTPHALTPVSLERFLWRTTIRFEQKRTELYLLSYNKSHLHITPLSLRLRTMKSQWGNYYRNRITLNAALLFLPKVLLNYVIAHELAHAKVSHHTKKFWGLVERMEPDFRTTRKTLRTYRLDTLMRVS